MKFAVYNRGTRTVNLCKDVGPSLDDFEEVGRAVMQGLHRSGGIVSATKSQEYGVGPIITLNINAEPKSHGRDSLPKKCSITNISADGLKMWSSTHDGKDAKENYTQLCVDIGRNLLWSNCRTEFPVLIVRTGGRVTLLQKTGERQGAL
jgi:hypothetical protein